MVTRTIIIAGVLAFIGIHCAYAGEPLDVNAGVDVRIVSSNSDDSSLRGGYGSTRFDNDHEGLRAGSAYVSARYRLDDTLTLNGDALGYGDGHGSAVDVTQLYVNWRPFPAGGIRFSSKVGLFYPEFSMENRGHAWTPVYTITPSAINSWYGEELHALGAEANIKWLGASVGYQGDVAFIAGVYGWNDPLGVAVAFHGWNFHDRQTGLFNYLLSSASPGKHIHEMREIDGRPGFYAGLQWHHGDRLDVRLYRYDNRADPAAFHGGYAWLTRFNTLDVRWEVNEQWTAIAQWLRGETFVRPQPAGSAWNMDAWFVLLSRQMNSWRLSLRRDEFSNDQFRSTSAPHAYDDKGSAWTFAVIKDFNSQWQAAAEWLRVDSTFPPRSYDADPRQIDQQWQLLLRYKWHH
ncbi:MAG: hypothetical protein ABUS47_10830 [Steroidobacter sp.]